ncbi:MAG: YbgA family protein, partial [candidate division KSB1 bacterium]|nr:YbgA family protein [candidate division KSB1 bacterium]
SRTGIDKTEQMLTWAKMRLDQLEKENLCGYIFKSKSPSSGMQGIKVYDKNGVPSKKGVGVFARAFMERFPLMPVEDEGRLNDARLRENFIERVFVYKRWLNYVQNDGSRKGLVDFHTDHKLLIMAHSPKHLSELGKLVAQSKELEPKELQNQYLTTLMTGLKLHATVKKNVNVLQHGMGYFKKQLSADEKQELLEVIGNYHKGLIPLIVPITLLNHYVRKYNEPYLKRQYYLNPHPIELMLRNHV